MKHFDGKEEASESAYFSSLQFGWNKKARKWSVGSAQVLGWHNICNRDPKKPY